MIGKWQFSSWQMYMGAAVGGAVGGWLSEYITPIGGAAVGGFISNFIGQGLEKVTGENDSSWGEIAITSGVNSILYAGTATFAGFLKIPGITSGSHSFAQVWKSGVSKTVSYGYSMSMKTIVKGFTYKLVSNFTVGWVLGDVIQGIRTAHDYNSISRREPGLNYGWII